MAEATTKGALVKDSEYAKKAMSKLAQEQAAEKKSKEVERAARVARGPGGRFTTSLGSGSNTTATSTLSGNKTSLLSLNIGNTETTVEKPKRGQKASVDQLDGMINSIIPSISLEDRQNTRRALKEDPTLSVEDAFSIGKTKWRKENRAEIRAEQLAEAKEKLKAEKLLEAERGRQARLTARNAAALEEGKSVSASEIAADVSQTVFERKTAADIGGAAATGVGGGAHMAESLGGGLTALGIESIRAGGRAEGGTRYREGVLPMTTPDVNPYVVPHPEESFIAYGTKQLEMAGTNSFTAYGSDNLMQGTYNPKKGAIEQIGSDTIMKGAAAPQMNMLENLGEKEIGEATNVMPNTHPTAGVNLTDTGKSVMGATSPGNALVELGEKRQSEILNSTESTQSVGLSGIGAKLMNEHATLCNSCKKKEL